jgi:aryl sulfotransferase
MGAPGRPVRNRVYRNHMLDSGRWDRIALRPDDILVSTSYKAGTTWMQRIVSLLLFGSEPLPAPLGQLFPWVDARFFPVTIDEIRATLEAQTHRRSMKSHLPLDALPWDDRVKYVYVGRDGRDVFMSWCNHWAAFTDTAYELINSGAEFTGEPLARFPTDLHAVFDDWLHRGSFPWERDGYPCWSHFYHARSFWSFRELPNIHFVHYADLKRDLEGEMRRLAAFLDTPVAERAWPLLVEKAGFDAMKREAKELSTAMELMFEGGSDRFFFKGTNGRWKDVLTPEEVSSYHAVVSRTLPPDAAAWLEHGRAARDPKLR